ncbi:MAG: hypothetical protein HZB70_04055 [Candidatus Berkelbacteria bacterium]|nr:MAG: hypothetical protein HZB70_04055 [Candidatus Berkelbacteria bacterium]QQG51526.1 MAG: hypothetical protein HY845_03135 [Candidatus Berkelbacteria bacterium]
MPTLWMRRLGLGMFLVAILLGLEATGTRAQNPAGITVTPVTDAFDIKPGESISRLIRVINPVSHEVTLYPRVMDYHTDNEEGQPQFFTVKERSSPYAMSTWVKFSKPLLKILPNEEEKFEVTIAAPQNADAGGHYAAVLFSTEEPKLDEDQSQIGVIGLVGTLLLAKVPGEVDERMILQEFTAPRLLINPPADFSILFSNLGNVHLRPKGEIKIRNWSGDVRQTLTVNEGDGNVLPESKRRFKNSWGFDWKAFGKYTASAVIYYGKPEQQLTATRALYIVPLWFIIAVAVLILVIIYLIWRRRRHRQPPIMPNVLPPQQKQPPSRLVMR